jgi:hypothetical protein
MSFFSFLRSKPLVEITEEATLSELRNVTKRLSAGGFREFTSPHRSQSGGTVRLGIKGKGSIAGIGIIPSVGVKVP